MPTKLAVVSIIFMLSFFALAISSCGGAATSPSTTEPTQHVSAEEQNTTKSSVNLEMPHIHGLGFSADGTQLLVPAHEGFRIYTNGQWSRPEIPAHDYAGYWIRKHLK